MWNTVGCKRRLSTYFQRRVQFGCWNSRWYVYKLWGFQGWCSQEVCNPIWLHCFTCSHRTRPIRISSSFFIVTEENVWSAGSRSWSKRYQWINVQWKKLLYCMGGNIWQSCGYVDSAGVDPSRLRAGVNMRQQHRPNVPAHTTSEYWKRNMYLPFIDHLLEELQTRLLQCGDSFKALDCRTWIAEYSSWKRD